MRTAHLCGSEGGLPLEDGLPLEGVASRGSVSRGVCSTTPMVDRQTPVKTLPSRNVFD